MSRAKKRTQIGAQFVPHMIEMLESPAYRALSLSAHRVLSRIEIEHGHHGGADNGRLPVTYPNFVEYGVDRHCIAPAIRELVALGFIQVTEKERPSESDFGRHPNLFRITYLNGAHKEAPTHEWKRHGEEAFEIARKARKAKDEKVMARAKSKAKQKSAAGCGFLPEPVGETPTVQADSAGKTPTTVPPLETPTTIYTLGVDAA